MEILRQSKNSGRTPLEVLVILGLILILNIVFWAVINPAEQFAKARNIQREIHAGILSDAVHRYAIDNQSRFIPGIDNNLRMIGTAVSGCGVVCGNPPAGGVAAESCLDLTDHLTTVYLSYIPYDPKYGSPDKTFYAVKISPANRLIVQPCGVEVL